MKYKVGHYYQNNSFIFKILGPAKYRNDNKELGQRYRIRPVPLHEPDLVFNAQDISLPSINGGGRIKEVPYLKILLHYPQLDREGDIVPRKDISGSGSKKCHK